MSTTDHSGSYVKIVGCCHKILCSNKT